MLAALGYAIQALQLFVTVVPMAEELKTQYDAIIANLQKMQAENRDPTPEEWQAVHDARKALEAQLNS